MKKTQVEISRESKNIIDNNVLTDIEPDELSPLLLDRYHLLVRRLSDFMQDIEAIKNE